MRSRKALLNIISNLFLEVIVLAYGFIVPKIVIKSFGSNVNGLISSITQFLAYITLLEAGIGPVIKATLYKPIAEKDNKQISNILRASERFFRTISYIFVVYLIGVALLYPLIVIKEFDFIFTMTLIIIISISTFAEYYFGMTYRLFLQAEQKSYVISTIQMITYILAIISILVMAKLNVSIHVLKLISGLIFVSRPLLQNFYVKKKYDIDFKNYDKEYKLKNKWDGLAQHIAAVVHNNTDITILTFLGALGEISVYSVYMLVLKGVKSLIQTFTNGVTSSFGDMIAKKEVDNLNKKFRYFELLYFTIITIVYSCTLLLIVPFVSVYTRGITDVDYIRPTFAILIVLAEFVYSIRLPYIAITYSAGHFKETMKGAWIEAISNIVISIVLVIKYGLVGVAIGTLIAMIIRTIEFIIHSSKNILFRSISVTVKRIALLFMEVIVICLLGQLLIDNYQINSYLNFAIAGFILIIVSSCVVGVLNFTFYKNDFSGSVETLKNILVKKKSVGVNDDGREKR